VWAVAEKERLRAKKVAEAQYADPVQPPSAQAH
jgi:hypothetical protein